MGMSGLATRTALSGSGASRPTTLCVRPSKPCILTSGVQPTKHFQDARSVGIIMARWDDVEPAISCASWIYTELVQHPACKQI